MADETRYNGYANHATWCVNLWLVNEESSYRRWRDVAKGIWQDAEADEVLTRNEVATPEPCI